MADYAESTLYIFGNFVNLGAAIFTNICFKLRVITLGIRLSYIPFKFPWPFFVKSWQVAHLLFILVFQRMRNKGSSASQIKEVRAKRLANAK